MNLRRNVIDKIKGRLNFIYKENLPPNYLERFVHAIESALENKIPAKSIWDEKDVILITYGDSLLKDNEKPLVTLKDFLDENLHDTFSCVHILPFFPYSSDDGFSVIDYNRVNPGLGDWQDIKAINERFDLMFDLVINHISQESEWFRNYLQGKSPGKDYFIEADPKADLSDVVRPRSLPLLTAVETPEGQKHVWTTFSSDQIDLNFASPELLLEMIKILLFYIQQGARIIRLDAIAFLWKEAGTSCLHLPKTHEVVKLMRDVVEIVDPDVIILTETNVPNKENLSYFGDGDEAHMVYQFSLPPLLLHALFTGNAKHLTEWAASIPAVGKNCTFFNFTASHDGIGVRPLEGLLPQEEINNLAENMKKSGGFINTKANKDGSDSPYEMNITYFDALRRTVHGEDNYQVERFLCSQTIQMTLQGIPAFYIHSLLATPNDHDGVKKTGMNRSINRKKWQTDELQNLLDGDTINARVFDELRRRLSIRRQQEAFHPDAAQQILDYGNDIFVVQRTTGAQNILSISNVTNEEKRIHIDTGANSYARDLLNETEVDVNNIVLAPYRTLWLCDIQI